MPPPLLYDLTSLQRESNGRFGFSAKTTLSETSARQWSDETTSVDVKCVRAKTLLPEPPPTSWSARAGSNTCSGPCHP